MSEAKKRLIIGCTEPSAFQLQVLETIELFFQANPLKLCQNKAADLDYWLNQCDAVILSGGSDIHPRTYGSPVLNEANFTRFDVPRDLREIYIIRQCIKKNIPILGICRGHQMLGVFHKIPFVPDLSDSLVCHQPKQQQISHGKDEPMHWVELTPESQKEFEVRDEIAQDFFNGNAKDSRYLWVNSFHHQGLEYKRRCQEVRVLGTAPGEKKDQQIIEMMTGINARWLSVQWHPEYDWDTNAASRMVLTKFQEMIRSNDNIPTAHPNITLG